MFKNNDLKINFPFRINDLQANDMHRSILCEAGVEQFEVGLLQHESENRIYYRIYYSVLACVVRVLY